MRADEAHPASAPSRPIDDPTGEISASNPAPAIYHCESLFEPKPSETWMVKCRRQSDDHFMLLTAKTFVSEASAGKPLETLAEEFPATFRLMFSTYQVASSERISWKGRSALRSEIAAQHERLGAITKRELLLTAQDRVFVMSAEGQPDAFAAAERSGEIERWFAEVTFSALDPENDGRRPSNPTD